MAEIQRGTLAVVWGTGSVLGPITGSGSWTTQDTDYSNEAESVELKNPRGQSVTKIFFNKKNMMTLNVVVTGDTIAHAKGSNIIPEVGDIMTVTDTDDTQVAGSSTTSYLCVSAKKTAENASFTKLSVTVERWKDVNLAQTLS